MYNANTMQSGQLIIVQKEQESIRLLPDITMRYINEKKEIRYTEFDQKNFEMQIAANMDSCQAEELNWRLIELGEEGIAQ